MTTVDGFFMPSILPGFVSDIFYQNIQRLTVAYPGIFSGEGGSTNSVEDRGQRERGSGSVSPLVRGSTQFENE
jgi:hypothetical protein